MLIFSMLGIDKFLGLDVLPVERDRVNMNIDLATPAVRVFIRPPLQKFEENQYFYNSPASQTWKKWRTAFEQCRQYSLQAIAFPPFSKQHAKDGNEVNKDGDTECSVLAILSSGLPMPKSPSQHIDVLKYGREEDARQLEREERGWWSIRFQQILTEMKRLNIP